MGEPEGDDDQSITIWKGATNGPTGTSLDVILTTTQAAKRLGFSNDAVRRMCEQGRIEGAFRIGPTGHWRVPADAVDKLREESRPKKRTRG